MHVCIHTDNTKEDSKRQLQYRNLATSHQALTILRTAVSTIVGLSCIKDSRLGIQATLKSLS